MIELSRVYDHERRRAGKVYLVERLWPRGVRRADVDLDGWLIPVLVAAGWWRHVTHRVPLRYEATLWSIVFPLGMYGVAGHYLGQADHLPLVAAIGHNEIWVALAVWLLTFVAMLAHLLRTLLLQPRSRLPEPETSTL